MELRAVCSERERKARRRSWRTGSGVSCLLPSPSEDDAAEEMDEADERDDSGEARDEGMAGSTASLGAANVW